MLSPGRLRDSKLRMAVAYYDHRPVIILLPGNVSIFFKVIGGVGNLHHGVYDVDTSKALGGEQSLLAGSQLYVVACTL